MARNYYFYLHGYARAPQFVVSGSILFLPPYTQGEKKNIWSELESNADPLASQETALTARKWLLGQKKSKVHLKVIVADGQVMGTTTKTIKNIREGQKFFESRSSRILGKFFFFSFFPNQFRLISFDANVAQHTSNPMSSSRSEITPVLHSTHSFPISWS